MKRMKIFLKVAVVCAVVILLSGCSSGSSTTKSKRSDSLYEQWGNVLSDFTKVVNSINEKDSAEVELRITELDSKGYPKKYEFVGLRNGREFLRYDEDGDLKEE